MGILDRVSTLMRANINDLIDRAEDPEKMVRQLIADMNSQLLQVKSGVAAAIADEKQLNQRWRENESKAAEWERRAELAVERGQDDLAREALQRRNTFATNAEGFKQQYEEQARQVEILKQALRQLESKIQEATTKQELLIARSRRAKTETKIRTTLTGLDQSNALGQFTRIEEKVAREEARAAALGELDQDSLEDRFAALDTDSAVENQLAAMKAKKGLAAPASESKALGSGSDSDSDPTP